MPRAQATKGAPDGSRLRGVPGRSALLAREREARRRRARLLLAALLGLAAALSGLVGVAWAGSTLSGWLWLGLACACGCAAAAVWPRRDPDRWARGAAGELATAELLRRLRSRRWAVFHDLALPGSRANVDHLVIGPTGVWVVDSKAYRARVEAHWRRVTVGGVPLPTAAVRWEAQVVSGILGTRARPVIALHGRGLPRRGRNCQGVKVLPAARLVRHLRRGRLVRPSLDASRARSLTETAEAAFLLGAGSGGPRAPSLGTEPRSG